MRDLRPDLEAARRAWFELGKALDSGDFSPPEATGWRDRAFDALNQIAGALGARGQAEP